MSHTAALSFDSRSNKWIATFAGKVLAASPNKDYVINSIKSGRCTKATLAGVTDIQELGKQIDTSSAPVEKTDRFGINERFKFLDDFVGMVAERVAPSLIVTGEGGLGKTFTVNKALKESGLIDASAQIGMGHDEVLLESESSSIYTSVKGYSTAKGLYRTLYQNRNRIVIFDDCDNIMRDPVSLNLLKGALDSYDKRIISWNAESFGDDDLPRSFEFKGGIIFISNLSLFKIDQAIRSRAICVDLTMTSQQKIERMAEIIKSDDFLPTYTDEVKSEALEFLNEMRDQARELSLRTLISVTKVAGRGGEHWKRQAEYLLTTA